MGKSRTNFWRKSSRRFRRRTDAATKTVRTNGKQEAVGSANRTTKRIFPLSFTFCFTNGNPIKFNPARIWEAGLNKFDELEGLDWKHSTVLNENRDKNHKPGGGARIPLSVVASGVNLHDSAMLELLPVDRFEFAEPDFENALNLCFDASYAGQSFQIPTFTHVVGVVHAFHSRRKRYCKWCPRYEKTDRSFCALLHLAADMIALQ